MPKFVVVAAPLACDSIYYCERICWSERGMRKELLMILLFFTHFQELQHCSTIKLLHHYINEVPDVTPQMLSSGLLTSSCSSWSS